MKFNEEFIRNNLPYAFMKKGQNWIAINREYSDIGNTGNDISGQGFKLEIKDESLIDRKTLEKISVYENVKGNDVIAFYMYSDNCMPWSSETYYDEYMGRLKLLLSILA